jgi:hypothetical protein
VDEGKTRTRARAHHCVVVLESSLAVMATEMALTCRSYLHGEGTEGQGEGKVPSSSLVLMNDL